MRSYILSNNPYVCVRVFISNHEYAYTLTIDDTSVFTAMSFIGIEEIIDDIKSALAEELEARDFSLTDEISRQVEAIADEISR